MAEDFKPNIYPIMYWGLMYGLIAGFLLFIVFMLSRYLTVVWFPVFLAGVIWGGYRNYRKQKRESGQAGEPKSAIEEFKEAARDIVGATKEMVSQQLEEAAVKEAAEQGTTVPTEEEQVETVTDTLLEEEAELGPEAESAEQTPIRPEDVTPTAQPEVAAPVAQPKVAEPEAPAEEEMPKSPPKVTPEPPQQTGDDDTARPGPPAPPVSQ